MNRTEHMAWCKDRALEYVDAGNGREAMMSMLSDLGKHPETEGSASFGMMLCLATDANDMSAVRRFITGFN